MAAAVPVIALAGSAVMGVASYTQQKKAAKAQTKAMKEQQRMQEMADARARRQMLRQQAIARGETVNVGAQYGAMGSSGLAGGLSGLSNQGFSQLGFQQTGVASSQYITGQNIAAANYNTRGSMFDMFGSFFRSLPGAFPSGGSQTISSPYVSMSSQF